MAAFKLRQLHRSPMSTPVDISLTPSRFTTWIKHFIQFPSTSEIVWPAVRSGHRCVANASHLFVYGGYDPLKTYGELWAFNLTTMEWELVSNKCSLFSASSSVILLSNKLVVFGGSGYPFGQSNSGDFVCYSLKERKWTDLGSKSKGDKPCARYGSGVAVNRANQIFIHSGTEGSHFLEDLYVFDTSTMEWHLVQNEEKSVPKARYRHEVVFSRDKFYVFGGSTLSEFFGFEEIDTYDFQSKEWSRITCKPCSEHGFPPPRKAHSCVLYNNKVYMVSGVSYENYEIIPLNDFWMLNLDTQRWKKLDIVLPYCIHFHAAAVTPAGCMYIFGGVRENPGEHISTWKRTADLFQIWLDVPPLLELAWRTVYEYHCRTKSEPLQILNKLGIPNHLINRVQIITGDDKK